MVEDEELDEVAAAGRHQPPETQREAVDAGDVRDHRLLGALKKISYYIHWGKITVEETISQKNCSA